MHCRRSDCNQVDFLPFECDCCHNVFCLEHRTYQAHSCPTAGTVAGCKTATIGGLGPHICSQPILVVWIVLLWVLIFTATGFDVFKISILASLPQNISSRQLYPVLRVQPPDSPVPSDQRKINRNVFAFQLFRNCLDILQFQRVGIGERFIKHEQSISGFRGDL